MDGAGPDRVRRLAFDDVTSTNTLALEAARSGDPGDLWITAKRQLEGRGRRGRPWASEAGNLYASWLGIDVVPQRAMAQLPLVATVAVRNAIARFVGPGNSPKIKWPNDVLVGGDKIVGILLEAERLADGRSALVLGCGINIGHRPEDAPYGVTSLREQGYASGTEPVFEALAEEWRTQLARFAAGENLSDIRADWLDHAIGLGRPCTVRLPERTLNGVFSAMDEHGRLMLGLADGSIMPISAGDVFFS